jgi:hypothetical protein
MGMAVTFAVGLGVVAYLRRPLERILVELCGNQERAGFWAAFSAVALGLTPVIFAMAWRPEAGAGLPAVFEFTDQLKWGLIGLMGTVLVLGCMIGRSIVRLETRGMGKTSTLPASPTSGQVSGTGAH